MAPREPLTRAYSGMLRESINWAPTWEGERVGGWVDGWGEVGGWGNMRNGMSGADTLRA